MNKSLENKLPNKIILTLFVCAIAWLTIYYSYPTSPPPIGLHEGIGFWGWFDQSQYLKMTEQFLEKDFFNSDKYYPPLYPAIAAISTYFFSDYGYIVLDMSCSLICLYAAIKIYSRHRFDSILILLFIFGAYGFKNIFLIQWIIPWTTNLSSAIIAILALMLNDIDSKNQKLIYKYSIYSMILTTLMITLRPFETIPCAILSFGIIKLTLSESFKEINNYMKNLSSNIEKANHNATLSLLIGISISLLIIFSYAVYNQWSFDSFIFSYSKKIIVNGGFSLQDFYFKFASLINDSSYYGVNSEALKNKIPWISIMLGMTIINSINGKRVERYLAFAALVSAASYLTFNDLIPTGIFRYYNIHYFKWSIAVFGLSSFSYSRYLIINRNKRTKFSINSYSPFFSIVSVALLSIIIYSVKPNIQSSVFNIDYSKLECGELSKLPLYSEENKNIITRYIVVDKNINIDPSELHVQPHGINIELDNNRLNYFRDFRFVKAKGEDKFAILFNKKLKINTNTKLYITIQDFAGSQFNSLKELCNK